MQPSLLKGFTPCAFLPGLAKFQVSTRKCKCSTAVRSKPADNSLLEMMNESAGLYLFSH